MFEHIQEIKGRVLAIKITGEITDREHDHLHRTIKAHIAAWGNIRILLTAIQYPCFNSAEALYEDLRTVKLNSDHIERLAVVGDRPYKGTWVALFGLFSGLETDYFEMDHIEDAWQWITEGITVMGQK